MEKFLNVPQDHRQHELKKNRDAKNHRIATKEKRVANAETNIELSQQERMMEEAVCICRKSTEKES